MHFIYLALSFLLSSSAFAQATSAPEPTQCLAQEDVKRIISMFQIAVERNPDTCDAKKSYSYRIIEALLFGEKLELSGPAAPTPWNQSILPANWLTYIRKLSPAIYGGSNDPYGNHCLESNSLAYVRDEYVPGTMFVCKSLFGENYNSVDILETLAHEARHHQGYGHVTCWNEGNYGVEGACDESVYEKGSYAVTIEANIKMGVSATNIHPALRENARNSALSRAEYNLNQQIAKEKKYVLLADLENQLYQFDGTTLNPVAAGSMGLGKFFRRNSKQIVFLPEDKAQAAQLYVTADGTKLKRSADEGTYMSDYAKWTPEQRSLVKDYYWEGGVNARMLGNKIDITYIEQSTQKNIVLDFQNENIEGFLANADLGVNYTNRIYVFNDQGQVYRIEIVQNGQSKITKTNLEFPGLQKMTTFAGQSFRLNHNGQILKKNKNTWVEIDALKSKRFKHLSSPLSGSPALNWAYE